VEEQLTSTAAVEVEAISFDGEEIGSFKNIKSACKFNNVKTESVHEVHT